MPINPAILDGIPKLIAPAMEKQLKNGAVLTNLANRKYQGEITRAGDEVVILTPGKVSIGDYTGADITFQDMSLAEQKLKIDRLKYYGFQIERSDDRFLQPEIIGAYSQDASAELIEEMEQFYAAKYSEAVSSVTVASLTSANVISSIIRAKKIMRRNKYKGSMWAVIPSWFEAKIELADITFNTNNSPTMANGWMGSFLGIDFYRSENIVSSGDEGTETSQILFGTPNTFTHANALLFNEATTAEDSFKIKVKGLNVYGGKLVRQDQFVVLSATEAAETSI